MSTASDQPSRGTVYQTAVVLVLSLGLTGGIWHLVSGQSERLAKARFSQIASEAADELADRMDDYAQILRGGVGLLTAHGGADRAAWRRYVAQLDVDRQYPGIQGIGLALRVDAPAVAAHQDAVRAEGFPGYVVRPGGPRESYFPIVFLEPFADRNLRAFGYDMFSNPARRAAMERARDTGEGAMSRKVILVQEDGRDVQAGVLLYLPYYAPDADLSTVEARRAALRGFVYSPFRIGDLVNGVVGLALEDVQVRVFDGEVSEAALLFGDAAPHQAKHFLSRQIEVFGQQWIVEVRSTPSLEAEIGGMVPWVVAVAGGIISVLVGWLFWAMMSERARGAALAKANLALAQARHDAEAAVASKSRFLAAASHDIRQPVQALVLLSATLARQLQGHPARRVMDHFDKSLEALTSLLNGLLDVSKLDAGVIEADIRPTALAPVVETLGQQYALLAADRGLDFTCDIERVDAPTDAALLQRIVRNLLENALRYTPRGGISLSCRRHGDVARITVSDTGIGIPSAHLSRIFEEFHQVANPERDRSQGLGLGLAIVHRLAGMLGYAIEVESTEGQGSRFTVVVPAAQAQAKNAASSMQRSA